MDQLDYIIRNVLKPATSKIQRRFLNERARLAINPNGKMIRQRLDRARKRIFDREFESYNPTKREGSY